MTKTQETMLSEVHSMLKTLTTDSTLLRKQAKRYGTMLEQHEKRITDLENEPEAAE